MTIQEIHKLREAGEIASEQGDQQTALQNFDQAFIEALTIPDYNLAINILGHHLHIYKVYFSQTQNPVFMELMFMDTEIGKRIAQKNNITGQPLSVMQLRAGDYYFYLQEFSKAEAAYQEAIIELDKDNPSNETQAEYLGHLAAAIINQGQTERAATIFAEAHRLLDNASEQLRDFHSLIIRSGLLLREANGWLLNNEFEQARKCLQTAEPLVKDLQQKHHMAMRYEQWQKLINKLNHGS